MESKADLTLRKIYRGQLTRLCNSVKELFNSDTELNDLAVLCERIKTLRVTLNDMNAKIIPTLTEENMESECEKIADYESSAVEAVAKLEVRIKEKKAEIYQVHEPEIRSNEGNRTITTHPLENEQIVGNFTQNTHQKTVRLPKLDLVKFNGNLEMWPAFWEQYSQVIHNNPDLDDNSKFSYLKNQLIGKAALSVSGLTTSHSSYNDAIELLKSEYGQSERIVDCYIQKLCSISPVTYEKDASGLRRLYNTASSITRSLKTLGISAEQYGLIVKSMIFKVLPYNLRVPFKKYKRIYSQMDAPSTQGFDSGAVCRDTDYNKQLLDLLDFIKIEVDSLEQAQCVSSYRKDKPSDSRFQKRSESSRSEFAAQGLFTMSKECCLFCKDKTHSTKDCRDDSIILTGKKAMLRDNSRCFRCTLANHRSRFCKTRIHAWRSEYNVSDDKKKILDCSWKTTDKEHN